MLIAGHPSLNTTDTVLFHALLVIGYALLNWKVIFFAVMFTLLVKFSLHCLYIKRAEKVVSAKLIWEKPIIKQQSEKTGYSIGYSLNDDMYYSDHYGYKNVITGYKVKFLVYFGDGNSEYMVCEKGSGIYNILINKCL